MHDGIAMIGGRNDDLVVGQHLFELLHLGQSARPFGHFGHSMQFMSLGLLEVTPVPHAMVIV